MVRDKELTFYEVQMTSWSHDLDTKAAAITPPAPARDRCVTGNHVVVTAAKCGELFLIRGFLGYSEDLIFIGPLVTFKEFWISLPQLYLLPS